MCAAAANDDAPAVDGLLAQGVHVDSRHRLRTSRGWHHERYTPLISACSQVCYAVLCNAALCCAALCVVSLSRKVYPLLGVGWVQRNMYVVGGSDGVCG